MANISASEVKKLREMTGSGMMDCKKALVEAEGDFDKAIEILRKKGQKVAAKRGDREASEGLVIAKTSGDRKKGVILVLNCETDFVAKNQDFNTLANAFADVAINSGSSSLDELKGQPFGDGITIGEKITEQIGVIGEKIDISDFSTVEAETVYAYEHPGNQIASLAGVNMASDQAVDAAKTVAMQVAAMNPVALNKEAVPQDVIDKEMEIGKEQARAEGKPEDILEKIAMGKVNKFFKENTLLAQAYYGDNKVSVEKHLQSIDKDLTVTNFKRMAMK